MERYWFFTWRTYGTWLPGTDGFVGYYHASSGRRVIDNRPGDPLADPIPALERHARDAMAGQPVLLVRHQADALLQQFHETARYRGWEIDAAAVMVDHAHLVFGVPGDPDPSAMLRDWKSYARRALNRCGATSDAPRWWADGGSKRRLKGDDNRLAAIRYVRDQVDPLLLWLSDEALRLVGPRGEPAA